MSLFSFTSGLIMGALGNTLLVGAAIVIATIIFEDPTTVFVGVLSADGLIPVPLALVSLYLGIIFGDSFLYGVGHLARRHPRLAKYVDHELVASFRSWLERRFMLSVFGVRFIPGLRIPVFVASGFFGLPFGRYVLAVMAATVVWTTILFFAAYVFGNLTSAWSDWIRYGIAAAFLLLFFFLGRHNIRAFRTKRKTGA